MAMIVLRRPFVAAQDKPAQRTARPYDLSPAEMALVRALVAGMTPGEYAASAAVKISTVRSQIQSILAKTGTRRTTEVVVLFSTLPALGHLPP
jgi:DNA-binding CsgD family transcriptional regulator